MLLPYQVSEYASNGYGLWTYGPGQPYLKPDMIGNVSPSIPDPAGMTLLTFFAMSDKHLTDKESPAQVPFFGYQGGPSANSSAYSAVFLYTTHVLDAAIQTVNVLHKTMPFDFGIFLGDACNNTQHNEVRWDIDVIDGRQIIIPSSGAHLGANTIDYQKPYRAVGLDKSIRWYQVIGNHDQFWMGSLLVDDYIRRTLVGSNVLNLGNGPPTSPAFLKTRGFYTGVVDGSTKYGTIIDAGAVSGFPTPPQVVADHRRYSLSISNWMNEFNDHGFTREKIERGFACYHFYPKDDIPLKIIVLDDQDKQVGTAMLALDSLRYNWLVRELDAGEDAGELMIICAHIPLNPYSIATSAHPLPPNPPYPFLTQLYAPYSEIPLATLLAKLHTYQNLIAWISGHVHRNAVTPQLSPDGDLTKSFWTIEVPSLRDFPQGFRSFKIVRNSNNSISIFALDIDPAVNDTPGSLSPALISRSYAIATQQIFGNVIGNGPNINTATGIYNVECVKQLSPEMQAKIAQL